MTAHNPHERTKTNQPAKIFFTQKRLLTYFVLSYAFFELFLITFAATLNALHLELNLLPFWLMPSATIVGSWMPAAASVIVTAAT